MRFSSRRSDHTVSNWWRQIVGGAVLMISICACGHAPYTQRRQLLFTEEREEIAVGEQQYQQLLDELVLNYDPEANRIVRTISQRLAKVLDKPNYLWEIVVIDAPETVNVWVLPGGKVGVCIGVFPVAQDEAGLAVLVAHAVAHAIARHQGEKNARDVLFELGSMAVTFAPDVLRQAYSLGTGLGVILPFGQVQEAEADHIGILLAAKAGYDPRGVSDLWNRMQRAQANQEQPLAWFTTHPLYEHREQQIEQAVREALPIYDASVQVPSSQLPPLQNLERPLPGKTGK